LPLAPGCNARARLLVWNLNAGSLVPFPFARQQRCARRFNAVLGLLVLTRAGLPAGSALRLLVARLARRAVPDADLLADICRAPSQRNAFQQVGWISCLLVARARVVTLRTRRARFLRIAFASRVCSACLGFYWMPPACGCRTMVLGSSACAQYQRFSGQQVNAWTPARTILPACCGFIYCWVSRLGSLLVRLHAALVSLLVRSCRAAAFWFCRT